MTRFQRAAWLVVLLVTLVVFGLLVPRLPAWGEDTIALTTDTEVAMATASVVIPAGWDLDIASSSQRTPVASRDDVEVTTADAVWLGSAAGLLANVSQLLFDGNAILPEVATQDPPAAQASTARDVWRLEPTAGSGRQAPARVDVIRSGQSVVLVMVRGPVDDVIALSDQIDEISDSVRLDLAALDVEVRS